MAERGGERGASPSFLIAFRGRFDKRLSSSSSSAFAAGLWGRIPPHHHRPPLLSSPVFLPGGREPFSLFVCHFGKTNITFRGRRREGDGPADGRRAAWQGWPGLTGGRRSGSRERNESELFAEKTPLRGRKEGKKKVGLKSPGQVESGRKRRRRKETCWAPPHERTEGGGENAAQKLASSSLPPSLIPFFFGKACVSC